MYVLYGGALEGGTSLGSLDPESGVTLTGDATPIGKLISRAGDVDGDGFPDLLVSGASMKGRVYAVLGSDALHSSVIDDLGRLLQIEGDSQNEDLPQGLDVVGHVNSDNRDEIVVSSLVSVSMLLGTKGDYPDQRRLGDLHERSSGRLALWLERTPVARRVGRRKCRRRLRWLR